MKEIMALADKANQYVDKMEPWVLVKDEKNLELVHKICSTALNLFRILTIMIKPVTPKLSEKSFNFLNEEPCWDDIKIPLLDHKINSFEPLLTRIEDDQINQLMELKNV
jgi:methionyl-tRNA synthetase